MKRRRILDGLIGAAIMLVAILVLLGAIWIASSRPVSSSGASTPPSPSAAASGTQPADLGEEDIWLGDLHLESDALRLPASSLTDVEAAAQGVLSSPDGLTAEFLDVHATVPFDEVSQRLGAGSVVSMATDGIASIERPVQFQGREIQVRASGTVEAVNGLVVVEPTAIDVDGPDFISWIATQAAKQFVRIEYPIEGLPEQLVLRDVDVQEDGFRAHLTGKDVALSEGGS